MTEFDLGDSHGERREWTPASCLLIACGHVDAVVLKPTHAQHKVKKGLLRKVGCFCFVLFSYRISLCTPQAGLELRQSSASGILEYWNESPCTSDKKD